MWVWVWVWCGVGCPYFLPHLPFFLILYCPLPLTLPSFSISSPYATFHSGLSALRSLLPSPSFPQAATPRRTPLALAKCPLCPPPTAIFNSDIRTRGCCGDAQLHTQVELGERAGANTGNGGGGRVVIYSCSRTEYVAKRLALFEYARQARQVVRE